MNLSVDLRKKIWKYRSGIFTSMDFAAWDKRFIRRSEAEQKEIYEDYMKSLNTIDCCDVPCAPQEIPAPTFVQVAGFGAMCVETGTFTPNKTKKMETTMDTRTEAQQAKDYLIQALDQAMWNKEGRDLPEAYGLVQKMPKTVGELKQAVADGWLRIDVGDRKDEKKIYGWMDFLVFNDPKVKLDQDGYEKAVKEMRKAVKNVKNQIVVFGPEKGLEALTAFEAQTF